MAEKSLFWNALPDEAEPTGYDRNYNADDISDWLDVVLPTGVIKSDTGLKVNAAGGMAVSVSVGKAVINGKPYRNDSTKAFAIDTAPTGSTSRVDLIVLRFDRSPAVRNTYLAYKKGTAAGGVAPLTRTDIIYELALAKITVAPAVTSITDAAITDLRGDRESALETTTGQSLGFCPYLTAAKGYDDYYDAIVLEYADTVTFTAAGSTITFNIPQYGWTGVDLVTIYTNGMRERVSNYTMNGNTITFKAAKAAGTVVDVVVNKFIDGEGLGTALEQYKDLQTKVLTLSTADKSTYICNGVNDNIVLSEIAQAFHAGTYNAGTITQAAAAFLEKWGGVAGLAALASNAYIKIDVFGKFAASAPYAGTGAEATGYQWLALGTKDSSGKKLVFDFSAVEIMNFNCAGNSKNIIFYGADVHVIGANVSAAGNAAGTSVIMFSGRTGNITAENSKFVISTTAAATIAESGTFINCVTWTSSTSASAANFAPATNSRPVVVYGGTHYAYCGNGATYHASVFYTAAAAANAAIMAYGVNLPTVGRDNFYQTNGARINAGKCFISGITTTLALTQDANSTINGHIAINKT